METWTVKSRYDLHLTLGKTTSPRNTNGHSSIWDLVTARLHVLFIKHVLGIVVYRALLLSKAATTLTLPANVLLLVTVMPVACSGLTLGTLDRHKLQNTSVAMAQSGFFAVKFELYPDEHFRGGHRKDPIR